jgi:hypothetical protein
MTVADGYRLPLPAPPPEGADGFRLILYTAGANGFQNLAELSLPLSSRP